MTPTTATAGAAPRSTPTLLAGAALLALALAGVAASPGAHAEDALLYAGGSLGEGNTKIGQDSFNKSDVGGKVFVGTRPIALLGAELAYVDLGSPTQTVGPAQGSYYQKASTKGASAFGLIYLPIPMPLVDVYGKAGLARLQTSASSTFTGCQPAGPGCTPFSLSRTNTQPAYGVGAQMHLGNLAGRIEYEHFQTTGGSPSLLSVGVVFSFF